MIAYLFSKIIIIGYYYVRTICGALSDLHKSMNIFVYTRMHAYDCLYIYIQNIYI